MARMTANLAGSLSGCFRVRRAFHDVVIFRIADG